jgi:hypothetical protein
MKQKNKFIKERLKHKQEQLSMQAIRQERLNRTMQNTKDDIDQLIYALHELEEVIINVILFLIMKSSVSLRASAVCSTIFNTVAINILITG